MQILNFTGGFIIGVFLYIKIEEGSMDENKNKTK